MSKEKNVIAVIDCGTTNTRIYIVKDKDIVGVGEEKVGVRDTVITGSRDVIKEGLKKAFDRALKDAGLLSIFDIKYAVASGMITSEIGLIDLPHLIAPIGLEELSENVEIISNKNIFPFDIPIIFIRGIKNNYGKNSNLNHIRSIDFMRGEEVQVIGALKELKPKLPLNIIFLSSHTKIIHVDKESKICGSMTTISGQFFESLKQTFIAKCIEDNVGEDKYLNYTYKEIAP